MSHSVRITASGDITSLELTRSLGAGETGRLEVTGEADAQYQSVGLSALYNGAAVDAATFAFADAVAPHTGSDGPLSRVRGVTLQDYTVLLEQVVPNLGGLMSLPPPPKRYEAVLYDVDKPLGDDLPDAAECEEKQLSGSFSTTTAVQRALEAIGLDLFVIPGPGLAPSAPDDDYNTNGKTVGQVLSEILLTNGVRWWLEGDLLIVDGRPLPTGAFSVPAADREDVETYSWSDSFVTPEPEPVLSDYIARCVENATYEEDAKNNFETSKDATLSDFSESGAFNPTAEGGSYQSTHTVTHKENGQIVREEEEGRGYLGTPGGKKLGQTYVTVKTYEYHPAVREALVGSSEITYTQPDYDLLESLDGGSSGENSVMKSLWQDFLVLSPYISKQTVVSQRWNAEGLLRHKKEFTQEFAGLAVVNEELRLLYKEESRRETHIPIGGGLYRHRTSGRVAVDKPVYEVTTGEEGAEAEPLGIMRDIVPFSNTSIDESPGETVSIPLPTCEQIDSCLLEAERDYTRDRAAWAARESNNVSKRTHEVTLAKLKFLRLGDSYGSGLVSGVTHSVTRDSFATTITVETAHN